MVHEALLPYDSSSPFGFIQFLSVSLGEAGATAAGIPETSGKYI
jgi:hypothetical protein